MNLGTPKLDNRSIPLESALDVLERFGLSLQQCEQSREQISLSLDAIRDSLAADAVIWHSTVEQDYSCVGAANLTMQWANELFNVALNSAGAADRLVIEAFDIGSRKASPWPTSLVMARISKSRNTWVAALSFQARRRFDSLDLRMLLLARRMLLAHRQQHQIYEKLRDSLFGLVRCLTAAIDAKDPHTWGHSERVARIGVRLGKQLNLPGSAISDLYLAGLLHDIGKIGIRDSVLQKPGKLSKEEYDHIKQHPVIGDRLVSNLRPLSHLRPGVRSHHERWDGRGYPDGLSGEAIPLQARILAVADSCDAMMASRPYRPGMPPIKIDSVLREGAGTQWDPKIVESFFVCKQEIYPICQRGLGDSVFAAVERAMQLERPLNEDSSKTSITETRS